MESLTGLLSQLLSGGNQGEMTFLQGLLAVAVAYLGGVLSSLTPCVYPMIPITVSVVGNTNVHDRKGRAWHELALRSLAYVAGMALIYSLLGVVAGLTGKLFGSMTNTSGWYLGLGAIMTLAALVMLDVIPFDPLVWIEWMKRKFRLGKTKPHHHPTAHEREELSLLGAFTLGASSGFIAAPCTTPVLSAILAYIAKTQSVGLGLSLMLAFSAGLGTLLLVIAAFAGALKVLPRSGQWMKAIKVASGIVLLAFAEYLIFRAGSLGGP